MGGEGELKEYLSSRSWRSSIFCDLISLIYVPAIRTWLLLVGVDLSWEEKNKIVPGSLSLGDRSNTWTLDSTSATKGKPQGFRPTIILRILNLCCLLLWFVVPLWCLCYGPHLVGPPKLLLTGLGIQSVLMKCRAPCTCHWKAYQSFDFFLFGGHT